MKTKQSAVFEGSPLNFAMVPKTCLAL